MTIAIILQVLLGLVLLNVWLVRSSAATEFRGGDATSLHEEFQVYGLPTWFFFLVGFLKIGAALALLIGIWVPELVMPAAALLVALMLGAVAMHFKVSDPLKRTAPAFTMLVLSATLLALRLG